jgi:ubiquinone/menaquinone biosynthesis C-methylase UbiE
MMNWMRRFADLGIEGRTARWYDRNTRAYRMGDMRRYAEETAAAIADGSRVLEIAPGPGYLAIELAKRGPYSITGLEISSDFVAIARRNADEAGVAVDFRQGNAADMPFAEDTFDFIICTAAFKNFKEPTTALGEMNRVLRPGGTARIVDMDRDASDGQINALIQHMGVKGAEALFMKLTFKHFLRRGAYTKEALRRLVARTDFRHCEIEQEGIGFSATLRKAAPQSARGRASSGSMIGTPSRMG